MIWLLDIVAYLLAWGYALVFLGILHTFLPLRKNWLLRAAAFLTVRTVADVTIFSNDLANLLGALLGLAAFIIVFHQGQWVEKLTAILFFYPSVIAVNYLMQDTGRRIFFGLTHAPSSASDQRSYEVLLISTAIHTASLLVRLLFWAAAWWFLKKYLRGIASHLTVKMWLVVNTLMLAPFVAIFTIIYFMPDEIMIVYPICVASIFSSFGCIYLASYICESFKTAYHAQELEMKQNYYMERMQDEGRVRSIYHDLKNHLLVFQAQSGNGQEVQKSIGVLQNQIQQYENYRYTGNEVLDIIIRDKSKTAQSKQIDFSAVISFEDGGFIEPLDVSTIFGNALDNAIEASEKLPETQRLITVKASRIRDMLAVVIENNAPLDSAPIEGTTKKDTFFHGFGLSNIKSAVEKYEGQCSIKAEKGKFILKMVIPIP